MGPSAVRQASMMLSDGFHPKYLVDPAPECVDMGNIPLSQTNASKTHEEIFLSTDAVMRRLFIDKNGISHHPNVVSIGGDHSITFPILQAFRKVYGPVQVIHIDAHTDCSEDNFGEKLAHGTWVRNAIDGGCIIPNRMFSVGVRAPTSINASTYLEDRGGYTISAEDAEAVSPEEMATRILLTLDRKTPTYLSFDVDGLDPSFAPGTGTPEIGGLSTKWCLSLIRALESLNWVGMDLVEVAPSYDHSEITALAGATIIYNYICMNMHKKGLSWKK